MRKFTKTNDLASFKINGAYRTHTPYFLNKKLRVILNQFELCVRKKMLNNCYIVLK